MEPQQRHGLLAEAAPPSRRRISKTKQLRHQTYHLLAHATIAFVAKTIATAFLVSAMPIIGINAALYCTKDALLSAHNIVFLTPAALSVALTTALMMFLLYLVETKLGIRTHDEHEGQQAPQQAQHGSINESGLETMGEHGLPPAVCMTVDDHTKDHISDVCSEVLAYVWQSFTVFVCYGVTTTTWGAVGALLGAAASFLGLSSLLLRAVPMGPQHPFQRVQMQTAAFTASFAINAVVKMGIIHIDVALRSPWVARGATLVYALLILSSWTAAFVTQHLGGPLVDSMWGLLIAWAFISEGGGGHDTPGEAVWSALVSTVLVAMVVMWVRRRLEKAADKHGPEALRARLRRGDAILSALALIVGWEWEHISELLLCELGASAHDATTSLATVGFAWLLVLVSALLLVPFYHWAEAKVAAGYRLDAAARTSDDHDPQNAAPEH